MVIITQGQKLEFSEQTGGMEIISADSQYYRSVMGPAPHAFNSVAFNELNSAKCEKLHYLLFKRDRFRLGVIAGEKEKILMSPFLAPYGGFSWVGENIGVSDYLEACTLLARYAKQEEIKEIRVTLPAGIYGDTNIAKSIYAFQRANFKLAYIDLNHYLSLEDVGSKYEDLVSSNTRRNLRLAREAGLRIERCASPAQNELAYSIIAANRREQSLPLKLNYEEVTAVATILPGDCFIVYAADAAVAGAIVFRVARHVAQLIYWGDLAGARRMKPMNFLASELVSFYTQKKVQFLDLGISTDRGVPNEGLCEFKESIGCEVAPKFTFVCKIT